MTSIGQGNEMQKDVLQIPNKSRISRRDSRDDIGHSSALETKRSGTELSATHLKEHGIPSLHGWWNDSKKPVTQCSRASVLWVVKFGTERITEIPSTSMRIHRTHNYYLARFTQQIAWYLRNSLNLVWKFWSKARWERVDFGKVRGKRKRAATEHCEAARSEFLAQTPRSDNPASGKRLREYLQRFDSLEKDVQLTKCVKMRRVGEESLLGWATKPFLTWMMVLEIEAQLYENTHFYVQLQIL